VPKTVWKPLHEEGGCVATDPATGNNVGAPGMNRMEIERAFPQFVVGDEIGGEGWWNRPEVEPRAERTGRADQVIRDLIAQYGHTRERIALVSHGGFFGRFVDVLINNIHPMNYWFETENAAISCFSYGPERGDGFDLEMWRIEYLNRCEWLSPALRRQW
jgi:2,3-bisphosphoglycerate-dependent phosphoglycerate mutase